MKPLSSAVSPWTLLVFIALLRDTQAQCANNCSADAATTETSVTFESKPDCNISTSDKFSQNGSIAGLTPGKVYNVSVHCSNCCKVVTKPNAVNNLSVTEVTTSSVYLTWTEPEGKSPFYRVIWTNGITSGNVTVSETYVNITGLTPGVRYNFTVQSVAGDNQTESDMKEIPSYTQPKAVSNLNVTEVTTSSVFLNWTEPEGKSPFYRVIWTDGVTSNNVTVSETNMNITGLTPGVRYNFTVQSVAGDNQTESNMKELSRFMKPNAVSNLSVTEVTTSSVFLNWTEPEGKSPFYRVIWTDGVTSNNVTVSKTNMNITGLTPGVKHNFTVQSVAEDNQTESDMKELSRYTKPKAVSNLSVTEVTTSSVFLNWTEPGRTLSFYRVIWTDGITSGNVTVSETYVNITGLTPGVRYNFTVQSVAGDNQTESDMKEIPSYSKPKAVSNLSVTEVTTSSVYLNWTEPEGRSPFYRVIWTDGITSGNITVSETIMNVTGLTPGVRYNFTVQSVAEDNQTESDMKELSRYTKPKAVSNLSVTEVTTSSVFLNWTEPGRTLSFYRVIWTDGITSGNVTVSETYVNITGLTPGVRYNFTVQSVAEDNQTESDMKELSRYTKPKAVSNLSVTEVTTSSVFLNWTEPGRTLSFYRVIWTDGITSGNVTVSETYVNITGLTPGVRYNFTVQSVAGDNQTESDMKEIPSYSKPKAVSNLSVTEVTTSSVYLNWTEPEGRSPFYRVIWTDGITSGNVTVSETIMNVTGLTPGVRYNFTVQSVAEDNQTESDMKELSRYTKPKAVSNLSVTEVTASSVFLNWTEPGRTLSFYRVIWTDGITSNNVTVTETIMNVTGLTPGVRYNFTVQSLAGDNQTESDMKEVPSYTQPKAVSNLNVTEVTTSSVFLNWTEPEGKSPFYRVIWTDGVTSDNVTVTETYMNNTGLTPGVRYNFTVQSVAGDNQTESDMKELSRYTKPNAVINISVTEVTTSSVFLNWTEPEGKRSFYRVIWTDGVTSNNVTVTETNVNITGLTPGVRHNFTVQSVAGDNQTESEIEELSRYTKPNAVINISVTEVTTSSVYLNWTEPGGTLSFYRVKWTDGVPTNNVTVPETNVNITGLTPGVRYNFTVLSVAGDNQTESDMKERFRFTKPKAVSNLNVTEVTTSSVFLNWTEPEGKRSFYRVEWTDGVTSNNVTVTETNVNITGLTPGVRYNFTVQSVAGDNQTESDMREIHSYSEPKAVSHLNVTEVTASSVFLNWTEPEGKHSFYRVKWTDGVTSNNVTVTETNVNITGLTPGVKYKFTVQSVAGDNQTESDMREIYHNTRPEKVRTIMPTDQGTDYFTINWTLPCGKADYFLVHLSNSNLTDLNVSSDVLSANVTKLLPAKVYNVSVTSVAGNFSTRSDEVLIATRPTPPGPINITWRSNSSLQLRWSTPKKMEGVLDILYNITYHHNSGGIQVEKATYKNITLSSLTSGTLYHLTVETVGPQGLRSSVVRNSYFTLPNPVLNLAARPLNTTTVTVEWSDPLGVQSYYEYLVETFSDSGAPVSSLNISDKSINVSNLEPGSRYTINVTTLCGREVQSRTEQTFSYSVPKAVTNLTAENFQTTSIQLTWLRQNDYKPSYVYHLLAFLDGKVTHNDSTKKETYTFSSLNPGTLYNFQVFAVVADVRSTMESIQHQTKPEGPSFLTAIGSTTSLAVSWRHFSGRVSTYSVWLYSGGLLVKSKTNLSNVTFDTEFVGLEPGVEYLVVLVTKSGPHENSSEVRNATFPNPPGPITVQSQTVESINFTWTFPVNMSCDQCSFSVSTANGSFRTENTWYLLDNLQSGSPYNISVVTVGVKLYESTEVSTENYTRPHRVTNLRQTEITTESVTLMWEQPESKAYFSFLVETTNSPASQSLTVQFTNTTVIGLQSGSNFSFTVTTQTADGTQAEAVTVSYFTWPYGVQQLKAETLNSTDIRLLWTKPLEYKSYYKYWVAVSGCAVQNKILSDETILVSELVPGTSCIFCVSVEAEVIRGEKICISQYTMPEKAQPAISSRGSNSSMLVTWSKPEGAVERYQVSLNSSTSGSDESVQLNSSELDSSRTEYLFGGLSAGRLYSAMIITLSGPFDTTSALRDNATYPNPPGPIEILTKTNRSIEVRWTKPILMADAEFSYKLTITPVFTGGNTTTVNTGSTTRTFDSLPSGTSFDISVSTVGVLDFESEETFIHMITTRPLSVTSLKATAEETNITLNWMKPGDYKSSYDYELTWQKSDGTSADTRMLRDTKETINKLNPGSRYDFNVTTKTSDGTKAEPERTSTCTRASPVKHLTYESPNEAIAKILLSWDKPEGEYSGFQVIVNDNEVVLPSNACCSHNVTNLQHHKSYTINVTTLSCGETSTPKTLVSQTGITNPLIRPDFEHHVEVDPKAHNKFSIVIPLDLLDKTKGPITHVGVLVRKSVPGRSPNCSDCIKYLEKTYKEWRNEDSAAYLATVTKTDVLQSRSSQKLSIDIGDEDKWEGYFNGALDASTKYEFASVLFTNLILNNSLVNRHSSLLSITHFTPVELPFDPAVIGIAVGTTLGIFCVLIIVLIGFIIYWKRVANKESPDIQIHSLRAKVSVPVRVEDYEAYFRKQKADSNCGFAEEFEEMKPVGIGQSKVNAVSLENKPKNRYSNVVPYDSSRVKLSIIHGNPSDDYINANYLPGYNSRKEFIAAQGPLPTTVNAFWRMIWEKNVQTLVMLTRCNEQGRVKCEQYWSLGTKHFENITVTTNSEIPLEDWTIRDFTIKNVKTAETRAVRHFHFTAWPDHGVPGTTELLIDFRHLVREHMNQYSRNSPTVVHCSAGVGRTGTLIAIDRLMFQIERENIVDVYGIVHDLRMHRPLMVQTEDQYVFLNQCALDIIRSRTGTNVDLIYQNVAALSIYEDVEPKKWSSKHKYQST